MADITIQNASEDGGQTFAAASGGGDAFANDGKTYLLVDNGDAGAHTVTITAQKTTTNKDGFGEVSKANAGGSVAAGECGLFGPFPKDAFNTSAGQCVVTYDGVTNVTVAAIRMP